MIDTEPWTVHTAGTPLGAIQTCTGCGHVLQDNAPWFEGRVAIPEDQDDTGPSWWPVGQRIAQLGSCTITLPDRPLEADERLCAGAN